MAMAPPHGQQPAAKLAAGVAGPGGAALAAPAAQVVEGSCDGGHLDRDVVQAAAAAGVAKAAAAAVSPNKRCPCPNCRAPAAPGQAAKGSGSYACNVRGGSTGAKQQQAAGAAAPKAAGGKSRAECKATPTFNMSALPAKPLMHTATSKDVQGAKVGALQASGTL